ncbi:serine protein kinase RIO [Pseudonocardia spinosispora]|uniref:serine protein kinase RIO n=1 Tax=Pseudonocardia spinosispora TaxID=103441 RepID=UPI0004200BBD|nr:RIO1 family regulatory kinase/ATPase [Pseudonocardia spinosispora]
MHPHNFDDYLDDFSDDADERPMRSAARKGRRRAEDTPEPTRRGRLTESERARLTEQREDQLDQAGAPPSGDRWSSWDGAEHGPLPHPSWLVTELSAVDTELGVLKTGKEADVHLVERLLPGTGRRCLLAAKRYRAPDHRLFHRDAGYLEGRRVRRSREMRAMNGRTAFGRNLLAEQWAVAEFSALGTLWSHGAPVPYPVQRAGTEVMLEFLGEPDGTAAPRLAQLRPEPDQLTDLWSQLVGVLHQLARQGLAHGDLSAYNLLVHRDRLIMIDLPQVVDVVANPNGPEFLERDVRNIASWFLGRGIPPDLADPGELTASLLSEAF